MKEEDFKKYMEVTESTNGTWKVHKDAKFYNIRFEMEKDRITYIFRTKSPIFTKCLENIASRVEDFVVNKKDTFDDLV